MAISEKANKEPLAKSKDPSSEKDWKNEMTNKKSTEKGLVEKIVQEHLNKQKVEDCLLHPEIPEVISNPSFLIVPKLGSLIALYVYELPEPSKFWMFTLEVIEDLFEVKTAAGENTTVAIILIEKTPININLYNFKLLERLFDKMVRINSTNERLEFRIRHFVDDLLAEHQAKKEHLHLWETEVKARSFNFENATKADFVSVMLNELESGSPLRNSDGLSRKQLRTKTGSLEFGSNRYTLIREPKVNNIKELFLSGSTPFYFTFDFGLIPGQNFLEQSYHIDRFDLQGWIEKGSAFINVMPPANKVYPYLKFLRRMATYARFISYQAYGPEGGLELRDPPPKLYMILEGSLIGPDFDPTRYLRMLTSSGWTPIRFNTFSTKFFEGGL